MNKNSINFIKENHRLFDHGKVEIFMKKYSFGQAGPSIESVHPVGILMLIILS